MELEDAKQGVFASTFAAVLKEGWESLLQSIALCKNILYLCESVDEWDTDEQKCQTSGLRRACNLKSSLLACVDKEAFSNRLVDTNDPNGLLNELMRNIGWAEKDLPDVPDDDLKALMQPIMAEAKKVSSSAASTRLKIVQKDLHDAAKKAEPAAGSDIDGKMWTEGLGADVTWDELVARANTTILKVDPKTLPIIEKPLTEVSCMTGCDCVWRHIK